jgi:hypothetical protein
MTDFVAAEELDNLLKGETRESAIFNIFDSNHMDEMRWGQRIKYEHNERIDDYDFSWKRRYLGENIKVSINLTEQKVRTFPTQTSFVFFLQDYESHNGHLVVFSEPNPRVVLDNPSEYLFAHDPDFVCIYSYATSIKQFDVEVYRNVYKEQCLTAREYLQAIVQKDYMYGCAFLDNHPEMKHWREVYQTQYMEGRTNDIAFEFQSRETLPGFLKKVLGLMDKYASAADQQANYF